MKLNTLAVSPHKIIRRDIKIPFNRNKNFYFYEDNAVVTSLFVVMSAMFPPGEMFFIESVRNVREQIKDQDLLKDISAFIAQEAFHSREHKSLNAHIINSGYPEVTEIEAKTKAKLDELRKLSKVGQLAATVVMEHYTATLARLLLTDKLIQTKTTQETRNLWEWHALEELEHKSVAFDVLSEIGGNTQANRTKALGRVALLVMPILFEYWIKILVRKDIKFTTKDLREAITLGFGGFNRFGILSKATIQMLDITIKNFNPRHMKTENLETKYREKLFGENGILKSELKN